jgi:hypothetical protein
MYFGMGIGNANAVLSLLVKFPYPKHARWGIKSTRLI